VCVALSPALDLIAQRHVSLRTWRLLSDPQIVPLVVGLVFFGPPARRGLAMLFAVAGTLGRRHSRSQALSVAGTLGALGSR